MTRTNQRTELDNVYQVMEQAANRWGDKTALIFDDTNEKYTFHEVKERAEHYASVLVGLGIEKGDKVVLMMPNVSSFPFSWLGLGLIGGVTIPLNYRYQAFDAKYQINHSEAKLVMTTYEKVDMLHSLRESDEASFMLITIDEKHDNADGFLSDLFNDFPNHYEYKRHIFSETLMNIQYTSGTTGKPKGCMLSQKYWINIGEKIADKTLIGINEDDILLTSQPFYYMDPQWNTMATLVNGSTLVVLDRFSPSSFWKKVYDYGVTFFYVLGNMPILLLKMPESFEEKNHQVRFIGCSAIPAYLHEEIERRWSVPWYEVFGMTETGYDISMRIHEHDQYVGTDALGRPATDREVRIINSEGEFATRGELGEMAFRGKGMMDGYFKDHEATNKVFRNGWFHTGDIAYMNEDGIVFYGGRVKDMIRRSGENIAAAEVEEVIMLNDKVQIAACTAVEDEIRGEEVKAHIVPGEETADRDELIAQLISHCTNHLASFKVPRYWEIREDMPITPSERIAKHQLKDDQYEYYDRVSEKWVK